MVPFVIFLFIFFIFYIFTKNCKGAASEAVAQITIVKFIHPCYFNVPTKFATVERFYPIAT